MSDDYVEILELDRRAVELSAQIVRRVQPAAAARVLAAFAEPQTPQRSFALPEISTTLEFPAAQAISFHFVDYVVHSWDVARSLGHGFSVDDDLARVALLVAGRVADGPNRLIPGAAFRPGRPAAPDATTIDQVLGALGRSPAWSG